VKRIEARDSREFWQADRVPFSLHRFHIRPAIHDRCQGLALGVIELGLVPRHLAVEQSSGTARVETDHPVAHDLP